MEKIKEKVGDRMSVEDAERLERKYAAIEAKYGDRSGVVIERLYGDVIAALGLMV